MSNTTANPFKGKVKMEWLPKAAVRSLSEIYSQGWQCAFASADNKQVTQFVMCKDFLQDAVSAFIHNKPAEIYGFRFNPKEAPPLDIQIAYKDTGEVDKKGRPKQIATVTGRTRIITVNSKDSDFLGKTPNVLDFLHQFEKHLDLDLTEAYQVDNPEDKYKKCGAVLYVTTTRWKESPPMLSLYTLLLRLGCVHQVGDTWQQTFEKVISGKTKPYQSNDADYLRTSEKAIRQIMTIGFRAMFLKDPKKNYPEKVGISTLHNSSGIVALSNGSTKSIVKYWTRASLAEKPSLEARRAAAANGAPLGGEAEDADTGEE
jgi:hypothetical protein